MFNLTQNYETVFQVYRYHKTTSVTIVIALRSIYAGKKERTA